MLGVTSLARRSATPLGAIIQSEYHLDRKSYLYYNVIQEVRR